MTKTKTSMTIDQGVLSDLEQYSRITGICNRSLIVERAIREYLLADINRRGLRLDRLLASEDKRLYDGFDPFEGSEQ